MLQGVEIVIVCRGPERQVVEYATTLPSTVRVIRDPDGKLGASFRVTGFPFAVLIDQKGLVRSKGMPAQHEHFVSLLGPTIPPVRSAPVVARGITTVL